MSRPRRGLQVRRPRGQKCHRLRSLQAAGGLVRHAGGDDRGDNQDLAATETEATVMVLGLDDAAAIRAMSEALASSCDVSAAAHVPAALVMYFDGLHVMQSVTGFRLEGVAPSVAHRKAAPRPRSSRSDRSSSSASPIRGCSGIACATCGRSPPARRPAISRCGGFRRRRRGAELAAALGRGAQWFYDWGGGLI